MNDNTTTIPAPLKKLTQPGHRRRLITLAASALLLVATLIALTAFPTQTTQQAIPDYANTNTWQTYTLDAGNGNTLRLRAPEAPATVPSQNPALKRFVCAKPHAILVCAAMPLADKLYDTNPQNAQNPVRQALDREKLDAMRTTLRDVVAAELASSAFGDAPITLTAPPAFTPCRYRNRHADFFTATAQTQTAEQQPGTMTVNGRILYLPNAIFYAYGFATSDLGAMLLNTSLDSLAF